MVIKIFCFPALLVFLAACNPPGSKEGLFQIGRPLGVNRNEKLEEVSGLAASVRYPGHLWTHNDSGHPAKLFLLDSLAQTSRVYRLSKIDNRDWEDITIGPGPEEGVTYIYIGDIGDNDEHYPFKYIYRFPEPSPAQGDLIDDFDTLVVRLSDAIRDTEALMIDPITKNLYLVSKREQHVGLYEITFPFLEDTLTANRIATLPVRHIVAADISRDGMEILLKNYDHIYYWKRSPGELLKNILPTPPIKLPYDREMSGEAIAWSVDGSGFFTLGENGKGDRAPLLFYVRNKITVKPNDSSAQKVKSIP